MALDGQLVFAFAEDKGLGADSPLSTRLRLGRLRFAEELSAQQATVDQAWQRVERAISAFAQPPAAPER